MDIYRVQVEMMLAGNLAQMLTNIGASMTGLHGQVKQIENAFGGWGIALAAVGSALAAGVIVKGLEGVYEQTKKISDEVAKVKALGAGPEELSRVHEAAVGVTRHVSGTTEASATEIYREIKSIMGEEDALKAMEPLSRVAQLMGSVSGDYGKANSQVFDLIRSSDIMGRMVDSSGKFDLDKLMSFMQIVGKIYEATGGKVDAQTWLGLAKQGGISLRGLDDEGMARMAVFSQAMGGQRAGTAMMSMFQQMAGGTMFPRVAQEMEKLGLLKKDEWTHKDSKVTISDEASKRLSEYFRKDPAEGIKLLKDAMAQNGITDPNQQVRELFRLLNRATTQRFVGEGMMNAAQMEAEVQRIMKAPDIIEALKMLDTTSISRAEHNLGAAMQELGQAIGGPNADLIAKGINTLSDAVRGLTEVVRAIPETGIQNIKGLSIALNALVATIPGGGFVTSLREVIGALAALGASGEGLNSAATAIRRVIDAIKSIFTVGGGPAPNGGAPTNPEPFGIPGLQPQNYTGSGAGGLPLHNINYTPPPKNHTTIVHTALNLDGSTLARAVEDNIAQLHELPDSASSSNGVAYANLNDWNPRDS